MPRGAVQDRPRPAARRRTDPAALHLVFVPERAGGPRWFLWARDPDARPPDPLAALASRGRPARARVVTDRLRAEEMPGLLIELGDGIEGLARVAATDLPRLPASVTAWSLAAKLLLDLVARERIAPRVRRGEAGGDAAWGVSLALPDDALRFGQLARAMPPAAHAVPVSDREIPAAETSLAEFLDAGAAALAMRAAGRGPGPRLATPGWEGRFVAALTRGEAAPPSPDGRLEPELLDELDGWLEPARAVPAVGRPRLCLKLDAPADGGAAGWPLLYFLQAADEPSLLLPAGQAWATSERRLTWMDRSFAAPQDTLLERLGEAARLFPPIERSLDAPRPEGATLTTDETWRFLSEAAPLLAEAGHAVLLPAELSPSGQRRLTLRMRVGDTAHGAAGSVATGAGLSLDTLLGFRWDVAVGDQPLSARDFGALVRLKRPLVRWRGQWVVLDPAEVAEVQRMLSRRGEGVLTLGEALGATLGGGAPAREARVPVHVLAEGALAALVERLRARVEPASAPAALAGILRPYQARGVAWLGLMAGLGLGGCLADDMGLGKTVQLIAFLLARRERHPEDPRPALVVCPTSVLGNWEREIERFAPSLPIVRHHGPSRARDEAALRGLPHGAVVLTTYALLRRDQAALALADWGVVALDEAQNIKNPASRQAQAARALRAAHRFALTGTPVENRLAELWSVLQFALPGLLGSLEQFRQRFAVPIERYHDEPAAAALRRLVAPFVLRRAKSDPDILPELPPKQEMAVFCTLTREQATLYQAALDEAMAQIEAADGIARRGRVLALLAALKQICNHPAQYLREPGPLPGRSGKLDRLTEMLEETLAAGDRALVFTQFTEMGARLVPHLERALGAPVLYLHGAVPRAARDALVRRFQDDTPGPPVFVLSLRAGGTGINLTRAARVFHFDRWWNPAVEDQATDRAHRIGQTRLVQVYRLLAAGTVEEKVDALLAGKRALAGRVVGAGETWITELSDGELRALFSLSRTAVVADDLDDAPAGARRPIGAGRRR